eukprot:5585232-Pleurochrysis_carterae.AAC.1
MSSPRPSWFALAAAMARSSSAARTPRISSSSEPLAGLATTGTAGSRAFLTAASAAARAPSGSTRAARTTARAVICSAECSCPAARAPASARAAARDISWPARSPLPRPAGSPMRRAARAAAAIGSPAVPGAPGRRIFFGAKSSPSSIGRLRTLLGSPSPCAAI